MKITIEFDTEKDKYLPEVYLAAPRMLKIIQELRKINIFPDLYSDEERYIDILIELLFTLNLYDLAKLTEEDE